MKIYLITVIALNVFTTHSFPVHDQTKAESFLQKYGYLKYTSNSAVLRKRALSVAVKEYQRLIGVKETGVLDSATIDMMNTARCGVEDKLPNSESRRKKRFVHAGTNWKIKNLKYRITKYPSKLRDKARVDKEIARAFKAWSDVSNLTFEVSKRGRFHIDIRFEKGEHGDRYFFDDGTYAHAFYPDKGGSTHFNDDINWTFNRSSVLGLPLFETATHEFGHSLGLKHSEDTEALMYPYDVIRAGMNLHSDDINAIRFLYGTGATKPPDLCEDATIDTITQTQDGSTYIFKGDFYWKILLKGIAKGYPRKISDDWTGLEGDLDASFTWPNGTTYFFKEGVCWRFINKKMSSGYPKFIKNEFQSSIPDMLDAAFVWSRNGKTYFFKGDQYWKYDPDNNPPVNGIYPRPISKWNGIPNNIYAAFKWQNNRTYFFKGDTFYKYNDKNLEIDSGNPPYPRSTMVFWFKCIPL